MHEVRSGLLNGIETKMMVASRDPETGQAFYEPFDETSPRIRCSNARGGRSRSASTAICHPVISRYSTQD
jgi:hypothetical protein